MNSQKINFIKKVLDFYDFPLKIKDNQILFECYDFNRCLECPLDKECLEIFRVMLPEIDDNDIHILKKHFPEYFI